MSVVRRRLNLAGIPQAEVDAIQAEIDALEVQLTGYPLTPQMFGAVGNGVADDTVALQAWIDALIGPGDPVSVGRASINWGFIPIGTYLVSAPINILSVIGLHIRGTGWYSLIQAIDGSTFENVLNINGIRGCTFAHFTVKGPFSSGSVNCVLDYYWNSTTAARSSSGNNFIDIEIAGRFVHGFGISRLSNGAKQVDDTSFYDIAVTGGGREDVTLWQTGMNWAYPSTAQGNQTNYEVFRNSVALCKYAMALGTMKCITITGADYGANDTVFYTNGVQHYVNARGLELESNLRLWDSAGAASGGNSVVLDGVSWDSGHMHDDGIWIRWAQPGTFHLKDVTQQGGVPSTWVGGEQMKIVMSAAVDGQMFIADGLTVYDSIDRIFSSVGVTPRAEVRGFTQVSRTTFLPVATVPGPVFFGSTDADLGFTSRRLGEAYEGLAIRADGQINFGVGTSATDTTLARSAIGVLTVGDIVSSKGLRVLEGSNCRQGVATLAGGTIVVSTTAVTANSRILLTCQSLGTVAVPSALCVSARTAGTSFTILSSAPTDTSVIAYQIFEPA